MKFKTPEQAYEAFMQDETALYAKNLFAAQKLLEKGFIRNSDFEDVLKTIDEAHHG